jgi:hypothetical protein
MGLLSFLNPLNSIINAAERAHQRVLDAKNNTERIEAEKDRDYWRNRLELAQVAAQHDKWWSPRNIMGSSAAFLVSKLLVWDTALKQDVTPDPGQLVTLILVTIIGFYFGSRALESIAGTIANAISRRYGAGK